ncbi:branched-chain amino acid ABC transporter ATP-binding protein/permease [Pseudoduganella namucuonensis]|uniref:Branched-chain amino acid transport system permease protein n=1 Tax=Pseudoduganella namucuonensis TaxID=1035707 RepID=A0A1I7LZG9_9BURK|nr:branched-chain amino acid ABC transporter ATP-binding protein/permease [Pseudoduganella namucuonensis]SFV15104.1 branched-chain amino acid transport system permease protein [Pseudoduganella namucuonensis]
MSSTRYIRLASIAAAAVLALLPLVLGNFGLGLMNDIGIGAMIALGLVMLTGVGGVTSFGQAAFVGIAAYSTAWLTSAHAVSPWLGLAFALLMTGGAALIIGMLTLRLGNHYLPISTIAWGLSVPLVLSNMDGLGRHTGMGNIKAVELAGVSLASSGAMYYLIWGALGLVYLFSSNLLQSRQGRAMRSLRGGSSLLASVGADSYHLRLKLFVYAALLAGLAGWLYAHNNRFVSPSSFDVRASIDYLLMGVVGGLLQLPGALVGSAIVILMRNTLQDILPHLSSRGAQMEVIVFSLLFLLLLHRARAGLCGYVLKLAGHYRRALSPAGLETDADVRPLERRRQPAAGKTILTANQVVKRFGGLVAVNEVGFEIHAGDIVGLIGPNGAGKSTMFNLLTGAARLTSGSVSFMDRDVTKMSQRDIAQLGMARTFQHVKLRPQMSLLDNVALGAHGRTSRGLVAAGLCLDREEERRIFHEARVQLARVGLAGREHELAGSLPLGTQRMLEIARSLMSDPVMLVLDEPAAGLRHAEKQVLAELLKQLRSDGVTIMIVEHDMDFVMNLVDRLVVMNFGSKLMEGNPAAVRRDSKVQAAYLGAAA